jgi:hypothetical protein
MYLCSGSVFELGPRAAALTWSNCLELAMRCIELRLAADVDYDAIAGHIASYGAWDEFEICAMSRIDLLAFIIQEAASDLRNVGIHTCDELLGASNDEYSPDLALAWSMVDGQLMFSLPR